MFIILRLQCKEFARPRPLLRRGGLKTHLPGSGNDPVTRPSVVYIQLYVYALILAGEESDVSFYCHVYSSVFFPVAEELDVDSNLSQLKSSLLEPPRNEHSGTCKREVAAIAQP